MITAKIILSLVGLLTYIGLLIIGAHLDWDDAIFGKLAFGALIVFVGYVWLGM